MESRRVNRDGGNKWLRQAYFVNGIHDSGSILPSEFQGNVSILLVINECFYLLVSDGIPRREAPPLREDGLWIYDGELPTIASRGGRTDHLD